MRNLRLLSLMLTLGVGAVAVPLMTRRPRHDRRWAVDHERLPAIQIADSVARIEGVRRFHYRSADDFEAGWETRSYDLRRLTTVWFVLAPFSTGWRGPAHAFVSFGFDDSSFVAISIEARREAGEEYGIWRGLARNLELIYVIGDEADLVGRRAGFSETDVYLYPVRTSTERARALFVDMLERAERLRAAPEFYNTIGNSCTSNLVRHVNRVAPRRIPAGWKLLLPGYADEVARSLGLIDSTLSVAAARARFRINDHARGHLDDPRFSLRIRP
jgi:hypothetical protein